MQGFPISPDGLVNAGQSLLENIWNTVLDTIWSVVSPALSPLSQLGKIGLLLGIGALALIGFQSYRQGYEGRVTQATAVMGFASTFLVIADFIPPRVLKGTVAFIAVAGVVGVYNMKSYVAGDTESTDWYDTYQRLFGSLTLAAILLVLTLEYVVGVDLPILP
ncbi:hypothetical protein ACOZ4N_15945 [Halorientalis pallida]|uniref:hypothetical protein n=1 Tax=Halorientalis pallida TaxID=2479928 RepID=UPI003C6F3A2C